MYIQPMSQFSDSFTGRFSAISLEQLNLRAAMLERLDNKYVVSADILTLAADRLSQAFDVLDIEGVRAFSYDTCYFDDGVAQSYHHHQQGRRKRCKVRVRRYREAGLCFVEVKLKDKRGITVKRRMPYDGDLFRVLDSRAMAHVDASHQAIYAEAFAMDLRPVIEMSYRRMTLVAKEGGERMTIDSGIEFRSGSQRRTVAPDLFIVETKSARGNGLADKVLRALHAHPTPGCSKYCVGMAALHKVQRINQFLPALRRLGLMRGQSLLQGVAADDPALAAA